MLPSDLITDLDLVFGQRSPRQAEIVELIETCVLGREVERDTPTDWALWTWMTSVEVLDGCGEHDHARALCRRAMARATCANDPPGSAQVAWALCDLDLQRGRLDEAEARVSDVLGAKPTEIAADRMIEGIDVALRSGDRRRRREVAAGGVVVVARCLAARGGLSPAAEMLLELVNELQSKPCRLVSASDVALRTGELLLDAGRWRALDAMYDRWSTRSADGHRVSWMLLRAVRLAHVGELSAAERALRAIGEFAAGRRGLEWVRDEAEAQRFFVLASLNRVGDTDDRLASMTLEHAADLVARDDARAFIARRARGMLRERYDVPTVERMSQAYQGGRPVAGRVRDDATVHALPPPCERARAWWARLFNAVVLDLDEGRIARARRTLEHASAWGERLTEPALQATWHHARALVDGASGALESGTKEADLAVDLYLSVGHTLSAWNACRALRAMCEWKGVSTGFDARLRQSEVGLFGLLQDRLDPTDRAFFLATRSSSLDVWLTARCRSVAAGGDAYEGLNEVLGARWRRDASGDPKPRPDGDGLFAWIARQLRVRRGAVAEPLGACDVPEGTVVMVQVVTEELVGVFVLWRGGCRWALTLSGGRAAFRALAQAAIRELADGRSWSPTAAIRALSDAVGVGALDSLTGEIPGVRRMLVAPDDVGFHIPYAALCARDGSAWITRLDVAALPIPRRVFSSALPDSLRAVGVSVAADVGAGSLPSAPEEIRAIGEHMPVEHISEPAVDAALVAMGASPIVHLACHGLLDDARPWLSGLRFRDAPLTVERLAGATLDNLHLLFIAACWSGNVALLPGREAVGLPVAALAAGARHVIAPLWEVRDRSNVDFVRNVYGQGVEDPVRALCQAQRAALAAGTTPTAVWAPWVTYVAGITSYREGSTS